MTAVPAAGLSARRRSNTELGLLVLAVVTVVSAYSLVGLAETQEFPPGLLTYGGALAAMALAGHLASRRLARGADPLLLPLAFLLNGLAW